MKKYITAVIFLIQAGLLFSQAPVVSNVSFSQRTDGTLKIDIYYDLSDNDGETKKIEVTASNNNGSTWTLTCVSLTGDVGTGVSLGTNKHIIWDFYADNPNQSGSQYKVRITASEVGTMTGNDGKVYQTVKIGNQWWMAENLRETQYRNGNAVSNVTNNTTWLNLSTGARCAYDNDETTANTYGYLYNWYAVTDSRSIAPAGWHVPTDNEWATLTANLGGISAAGGKMKETGTAHWNSPNTAASNSSGFTAPAGGERTKYGHYYYLKSYGYFWSATLYTGSNVWVRFLSYNQSDLSRSYTDKSFGLAVRLIRD